MRPHSPESVDIISAARSGKKGFVCPGGTEHPGPLAWIAWSTDRSADGNFTTFAEAAAELEDVLARG